MAEATASGGAPAARTRPLVPDVIKLPAIDETWRVERGERACYNQAEFIIYLPRGLTATRAFEVLRAWLRLRAKDALPPMLMELSVGLGLQKPVSRVFVKDLLSRWGSCSSRNNVNLNSKLLFLPPDLVRHVMLHELCHLFEMNHSAAFYARLRDADPEADRHIAEMRGAWNRVPPWASARLRTRRTRPASYCGDAGSAR